MSTARRTFLKGLAALAAGGATLRTRLLHAQGMSGASQGAGSWDLSWTQRVTGKYRGVFDNPDVNDGVGLFRATAWKDEVIEAHGATADDINTVLVIRHKAIPLIMNDEFWAHHELGARFTINDPATGKPAVRNPYRAAAGRRLRWRWRRPLRFHRGVREAGRHRPRLQPLVRPDGCPGARRGRVA